MSPHGLILLAARQPLPAESPLRGPVWSLVVPAALFVVTLLATWALYRRFADEGARRTTTDRPSSGGGKPDQRPRND